MPDVGSRTAKEDQALMHLGAAERLHGDLHLEKFHFLEPELKERLRLVRPRIIAIIGRLKMRSERVHLQSEPTPVLKPQSPTQTHETRTIDENHPEIQKIYRLIKNLLDRIEQNSSSNSYEKTIDKLVRRLLAQRFPEESFDGLTLEEIMSHLFGHTVRKQSQTSSDSTELEEPESTPDPVEVSTELEDGTIQEVPELSLDYQEIIDNISSNLASDDDIRDYLKGWKDLVDKCLLEARRHGNSDRIVALEELLDIIDLLDSENPLDDLGKAQLRLAVGEIDSLDMNDFTEDQKKMIDELRQSILELESAPKEEQHNRLRKVISLWLKGYSIPGLRKEVAYMRMFFNPSADITSEVPEISRIGQALRALRDEYPFVFRDKTVLLSASISEQRKHIREYSEMVEQKLDGLIALCKTAHTPEEKEIGEGLMRRKDVLETLRKGPAQTLFVVQQRLKDLLEGDIPLSMDVIEPLKSMMNLWPGSRHGTAVSEVVYYVDSLRILIETLQMNPNTRREGQEYGIFERNCKEFGRLLLMRVENKFGLNIDSKANAELDPEELEAIDKIINNGMEIFGRYMDAKSLDVLRGIEEKFRLK
jgi:hypothetical protein